MSIRKIPLSELKERVEPLAHNRFSIMHRDLLYEVANGTFPREVAKQQAFKATGKVRDVEFTKSVMWLAVVAEQYGSATAKKILDEVLGGSV